MYLRRSWLHLACLVLLLAALVPRLRAQAPPVRDAAELELALDKLQVLGSVLYLAAHPDDENTTLLTYFAQGRKLRTAYLSLTRGEGGQNRIGTEQGAALGVLRTQELLDARRLDGAEQYFSRALDFGFSKNPEDTFRHWDREAVLGDIVWILRKVRPDVVVTRFSPTRGGTHGHHTASAILALEAFQAAGDPARFPEQLAWVRPWRPARLFWNSYRSPDEDAPASLTLEVGGYAPLLGQSYPERAALSRSQHRSQGFGTVARRGPQEERLELLAGTPAAGDPFAGIDLTWGRVPGAGRVGDLLAQARRDYRPEHPEAILPLLLQAKAAMEALVPDPWVQVKRADLVEAIRCAAGIWVEAVADRQLAVPGEPLEVTATILARNPVQAALTGIALMGERELRAELETNRPVRESFHLTLPADTPCSQPYWLGDHPAPGSNSPGPPDQAGLAQGPPLLTATFHLVCQGIPLDLPAPVRFRFQDPVLGERYQPVAAAPPVRVSFSRPVQVRADARPFTLAVTVAANGGRTAGTLRLAAPGGWRVQPAQCPFTLDGPGAEQTLTLHLQPPSVPGTGTLAAAVDLGSGPQPARDLVQVNYSHIPLQTLFPLAAVRLVRTDLRLGGRRIGYVMGSGDELPGCLRALGYRVDLLEDGDLAAGALDRYDAVVVGVRAFNVRPALETLQTRLLDYVARGGTEIVLYQVNQGLVRTDLGPFPFRVAFTRVTDPASPMTFLVPGHPLLNRPNRISPQDFQGWIQERGTYFAEGWDARYTPILATQDAGEPAHSGGLIAARHGRGWFVYTGLSFFRQLPAGVPGAYRLFANLLALGGRDRIMPASARTGEPSRRAPAPGP